MNRYSSERAKITNDLKDMQDKLFKIEDNTLIRWLMQLYDCSYSDAKDSIADARREIEESKQANETPNQDKVLDDMVQGLEGNNKLSAEEQQILEDFNE